MNKEVLFAKTLEKVRAMAKEQGNCIGRQQVAELFEPLELGEEQLQMVFDYLVKHKVGLDEAPDPDAYLSEEERNYLQDYLDEISRLPEYTPGQKEACILSAMAGETAAQNRLVEMYLGNVVDIAKLYAGQGVLLEDLIGEGNVALAFGTGMLGSLEHYSEADGMLGKLIMDAMESYIDEHVENEKADRKVLNKVNKVSVKAHELSEDLGRKITVQELAEESGMSENYIREAMRMSGFQIDEIEGE